MAFCLLANRVKEFRKNLKERKINLADLLNMSTEKRTKLLEYYAGKNAKDVNLLFEKKLVLKNKIRGIENWASKAGEIGRYSPKKKAEIVKMIEEFKKQQEERIFNPKEEESFYNDLADLKIGTHITREEAKTVFDLTQKADEFKKDFNQEAGEWKTPEAKANYGAAKVVLEKYIDNLKDESLPIKDLIKQRILKAKTEFAENKVASITSLLKDAITTISDNAISFVASIDNSFLGRQGLTTLQTHPSIWYDAAKKSFSDIYQSLKSKKGAEIAKDTVMADVYSSPNYINGSYEIAKLIPKTEEQFPTTLPERIPILGRAFKASENAFVNSAIRMRTKLYDVISDIAKKNGVDITDKTQIQEMGKLINSVTARGDLGKAGSGGVVRLVLWAPKMLKANWDVLTAHTFGAGLKTPFARRQAKINLLKIVATTYAINAIANAISPGSAETNPISSDFGNIKVGNTRFNYTGGKNSLITLIARGLTLKTKSANTGIIKELNTGEFGSQTYFDIGMDFLTNKTTPFAKAVIDKAKGKNIAGEKPTLGSAIYGLTTPISIQNFVQNFYGEDKDGSVAAILGSILDIIGINTNTYSIKDDWELKDTKELNQFKTEVGEETFKKANKAYNDIIGKEITDLIKTEEYKKLSEDEKLKKIDKIKKDAKSKILKEFNP